MFCLLMSSSMIRMPRIFTHFFTIYVGAVRIASVLVPFFMYLGKCLPTPPFLRDYHYAVVSQILYNFFSDFFLFFL